MAFLDNTGLARLWEHIVARFVSREQFEVSQGANLLDNTNFLRSIKRRESFEDQKTGTVIGTGGSSGGGSATGTTTSTTSFIIDRWRASSGVTATNGTGLIFATGTNYIQQGLEIGTLKNTIYTFVLTYSDDARTGGIIDLSSSNSGSYTDGTITCVLNRNYNDTYDKVSITVYNGKLNGATLTVKNIALYEGEYSSLPTYVPKTLAQERERAALFFQAYRQIILAGRCTSGSMMVKFHFPTFLRSTNYTILIGKDSDGNELGGTIYCNNKTPGGVTVQSITLTSSAIDTAMVTAKTADSSLTSNESGVWQGASIGFNADYA